MKHFNLWLSVGTVFAASLAFGQSQGGGSGSGGGSGTPLTIYVSPRGNDRWTGLLSASNSGRNDGPKRTLEGARSLIRQRAMADNIPLGGVIVQLLPGTYNLATQFSLEQRWEKGTPDKPIVVRGSGPDQTILDGSTPLRVWRRVTREPRIRSENASRIFVADLRQHRVGAFVGFQRKGFPYDTQFAYPELIFRNQRMTVAQYPNGKDWLTVSAEHGSSRDTFASSVPRTRGWASTTDAWVYGYLGNQWADAYEKVGSMANDQVQLTAPAHYGIAPGQRFRFVNVLQELDAPGEYFIDRASMKVFFFPPATGFQNSVSITGVNDMLIKLADCEYTTWEDMTIQNTRATGLEVHRGRDVTIRNVTFRNNGVDGVRILNGVNHKVDSCKFTATAETPIWVLGGSRTTLTSPGHEITNNEMSDFSQVCRSHKPGIRVEGVGHLVSNNSIFRAPGMAIFLLGNDHIIEKNHLKYVCYDNDDVGAIYLGQNPTFLGNVIRQNLIEDLPRRHATTLDNKVNAIYLDDFTCGTQVYDNVIRRADMGIQMGGGSNNNIVNNVFLDCRLGVQLDARGTSWNSAWFSSGRIANLVNEVGLSSGVYAAAYPDMANWMNESPAIPHNNRLERNVIDAGTAMVFFDNVTNSDIDDPTANLITLDNVYGGGVGFVDAPNNNFNIIPNSDVYWINFQPIDLSEVGVQINADRQSPVVVPGPPTDY